MQIKQITDKEIVWAASYDDPAKAVKLLSVLGEAKLVPEDHSLDIVTWLHGSIGTRIAMLIEWLAHVDIDVKLGEAA